MKKTPPVAQSTIDRLNGNLGGSLKLRRKAFPLVPGSDVAAIVVRELSGFDDDDIARTLVLGPETSMLWASKIMKREAIRRSIVGYWPAPGAEFVEAQQPFESLDKWNLRTQRQLGEFFEMMNGTEEADLKKAVGAATDWQPGDGAPTFPAAAASVASTGNGSSTSASSESGSE